jgi:hypothetical protein
MEVRGTAVIHQTKEAIDLLHGYERLIKTLSSFGIFWSGGFLTRWILASASAG